MLTRCSVVDFQTFKSNLQYIQYVFTLKWRLKIKKECIFLRTADHQIFRVTLSCIKSIQLCPSQINITLYYSSSHWYFHLSIAVKSCWFYKLSSFHHRSLTTLLIVDMVVLVSTRIGHLGVSWLTAAMYVWYFQCITFVEEFTRVCTCDGKNATSSRAGGNTTSNNNLRPTENTNKDIRLETCSEPQRHFAMIKIEKTGSSTLYTILGRFVREHKLNMISQLRGVHINFRAPRGQGEARYNTLDIKR